MKTTRNMDMGIGSYKDLFELISYLVTSIGIVTLVYAVFSYNLTKKQLNFSVLNRCITIFQDKFIDISRENDIKKIKSYIDFVNEELFYFESGYIPQKVALEWIDGMIEIIPIYDYNGNVLNQEYSNLLIHEKSLLLNYQRIKSTFTIKKEYDFKLIYCEYEDGQHFEERRKERTKLLKELYKNLK